MFLPLQGKIELPPVFRWLAILVSRTRKRVVREGEGLVKSVSKNVFEIIEQNDRRRGRGLNFQSAIPLTR